MTAFASLVARRSGEIGNPTWPAGSGVDHRWRTLLGAAETPPAADPGASGAGARVGVAESMPPSPASTGGPDPEATLRLTVEGPGGRRDHVDLVLIRSGPHLHGIRVAPDGCSTDRGCATGIADALLWRGVVRCAASLRLASLQLANHGPPIVVTRRELQFAAALAEDLEIERASHQTPDAERRQPATGRAGGTPLPVRLEIAPRLPRWKRTTDLTLGVTAAAILTPVAAACALLVRRSSPGPIIFRQLRVGAGGLPFQMYKFRTMHVGNDDEQHREQNRRELLGAAEADKSDDDPRITPIGRWLRRLSLDELPQLANVLRGEMSLVGPRPSLLWEVELFASPSRRRLTTHPGITGLWQTTGRADVSMLDMLQLDLDYIDSMSAAVDARCLATTARSVFTGEGAA